MATAANTPRSWLRPRFSLRVLLLAVTAFAIGFPIWYRWPYEEVEQLPSSFRGIPSVDEKRATTWQRQWGGSRLKHGPERHLVNGKTQTETNYREGKKHGRYLAYPIEYIRPNNVPSRIPSVTCSAEPATAGQYVDGMKEGVWTYSTGNNKSTLTWRRDQLANENRAAKITQRQNATQ
jgi:hypothetical protein